MLSQSPLSLEESVEVLKAAGEPTRLRLIALLAAGDLTVSEMTEILGQSQPRISRHLKLLGEARLGERYQEGAWAYFRLMGDGLRAKLVNHVLEATANSDTVLNRDAERLKAIKQARADRAQAYFSANAEGWNELRKLLSAPDPSRALLWMRQTGALTIVLPESERWEKVFLSKVRGAPWDPAGRGQHRARETELLGPGQVRFFSRVGQSLSPKSREKWALMVGSWILRV